MLYDDTNSAIRSGEYYRVDHRCKTRHVMNVKRNAEVLLLLHWKSNKYYTNWACFCSPNYPACNAHAPYCQLWHGPLYNIFPHYLIKGMILGKKRVLERKMCISSLSTHLSGTLPILRRNEREIIKTHMSLHVKYRLFLSDVNKPWLIWTYFCKTLKFQTSVLWELICCVRTDGRRDMTEVIVAFRNFANAPKKGHTDSMTVS